MNINYKNGVQLMKDLSNKTGTFSPHVSLTINYPGKKQIGDYIVFDKSLNAVPTHYDVSTTLYNFIKINNYSFSTISNLLLDVYTNGTETNYNDEKLDYLKNLVFWTSLQEEINYPRSNNFAGINLAFCRYYESICAALESNPITLNEIATRCNNHGKGKPTLYKFSNPPHYYHY